MATTIADVRGLSAGEPAFFRRYVEDKRSRRPYLYLALLFSTLLELGLLLALMVHTLMDVPELAPPPLRVVFLAPVTLPPPPAPPRGGRTNVVRSDKPKPDKPNVLVQPDPQKPTPAVPAVPDDGPVAPDSPPGDGDGPGGDGPPGGTCVGAACDPNGKVAPIVEAPPRKVAALQIRKQRLSYEDPHLPEVVRLQHRGQDLLGSYQMCIDRRGVVTQVIPLRSIPGGDEAVIEVLRRWTYQGQAAPVCFVEIFRFEIP